MGHYTYLTINLLTLFFPLILSFDRKVHFISHWPHILTGILMTMLVFIPWDISFTAMGIWGFNPDYYLGITLWGMPMEEYMFFITVPYACLFIYACLRAYIHKNYLRGVHYGLTVAIVGGLTLLFLGHINQTYTAVSCLFMMLLLLLQLINIKRYMGWFYMAYALCLIPFFIVNGVLTSLPVVWYNDHANLGIRAGTIPVDDFIYNGGMLLLAIMGYEWSNRKFFKPTRHVPVETPQDLPAEAHP